MQKETRSIGFACALGAFLGAFTALELAAHFSFGKYIWFIGAIIGGSVAYLTYDFKTVCRGIAHTWRKMRAWRPQPTVWRILRLHVMLFVNGFIAGFGLLFWSSVFYFLAVRPDVDIIDAVLFASSFLSGIVGVLVSFSFFSSLSSDSFRELVLRYEETRRYAFCIIVLPWHVIRLIVYASRRIPSAALFVARFAKQVFIYIHSNERLLCLTDAAIGSAIGYFAGSALAGAIAGGLFGILNYEVISVHVLKIAPKRSEEDQK